MLKAFEVAKKFMMTGKPVDSDIINKILNISITDKDLDVLLKGPKHKFSGQDLLNHKDIMNKLRSLLKKVGICSGVYI